MILTLYPIQLHPCFSVHVRICHNSIRSNENHSTIWVEPKHKPPYPKVSTIGSHNPSLDPGILHSLNYSSISISLTCLGRGHSPHFLLPSKYTSPSCLLSPSLTEGEAGAREGDWGRKRSVLEVKFQPQILLNNASALLLRLSLADSNRPCLCLADTRFPFSGLPGLSSLFPDLIRKQCQAPCGCDFSESPHI